MEELLGRQPPHSAPAEQAVIGAMLIDPSCIPDVIEKVKSDEFYIQANRDIFDTIFAMFSYGQSVDAVTVLEQMKVRGVYKDTTQQYLMDTATPKRKTTSDIMRAIFTATPSRTNFLSRNTFPKNTRSPWFFSDTATAVSSDNAILKTTATRSALFCRAARVNPASWWARVSFSQTPSQR